MSVGGYIGELRRIVTHPVEELNRWQRWFRYFVEVMGHCWRQLNEDRAEEMAAALTYRTIFSLIPLVVLGLVVFRLFGGFEVVEQRILPAAYTFFGVPEVDDERYFGTGSGEEETQQQDAAEGSPSQVTLELKTTEQEVAEAQAAKAAEEGTATPEQAAASAEQTKDKQQVRGAIQKAISDLIGDLSTLNFTSIGVVGVLVFIYAAMTLALAVEYDFNIIFKSPTGRPWHLRVPVYWSMLTLGSGLLGLSLYLTGEIVQEAQEWHVWEWLLPLLSRTLAFLASWGMLFLLYVLVPATRVLIRPALLGSFVAALLWEACKIGFQAYVSYALPYADLYGALGLIPLFLFWVYLSWLIVLFGLELTFALQMMPDRRSLKLQQQDECDTLLDPRWLIPTMTLIGESFHSGQSIAVGQIAQRMSLPVRAVSQMMNLLCKAGLVHRVEDASRDDDPGYSLSRPADQINVAELLRIGRDLSMHDRVLRAVPAKPMLDELSEAEHKAVDGVTLAQLVEQKAATR